MPQSPEMVWGVFNVLILFHWGSSRVCSDAALIPNVLFCSAELGNGAWLCRLEHKGEAHSWAPAWGGGGSPEAYTFVSPCPVL